MEKVLVFDNDISLNSTVVTREEGVYLFSQILKKDFKFVDRELAEKDSSILQLIPYCVIMCGNEVFKYRRHKTSGEKRLVGKWSIGIGGHINPCDTNPVDENNKYIHPYLVGARRELQEEIGLDRSEETIKFNQVGCIYDDSNEVGKVHFGVVHIIQLIGDEPLKFDDEAIADYKFENIENIKKDVGEFENWSQLVINNILN